MITNSSKKVTNQFKVVDDLGVGLTAQVKLVQEVETGNQYACKLMKTGPRWRVVKGPNGIDSLVRTEGISEQTLIDVQKEMAVASQLNHQNIIKHYMVGNGPYDTQIAG